MLAGKARVCGPDKMRRETAAVFSWGWVLANSYLQMPLIDRPVHGLFHVLGKVPGCGCLHLCPPWVVFEGTLKQLECWV